MEEQKSEVKILYYLSIATPLGLYSEESEEATQDELFILEKLILSDTIKVLRLVDKGGDTMFFGSQIIKNSIITINLVNKSLPF